MRIFPFSEAADVLRQAFELQQIGRYRRGEARAIQFVMRAQLPYSEIVMVQLISGEMYPQWSGATDAQLLEADKEA